MTAFYLVALPNRFSLVGALSTSDMQLDATRSSIVLRGANSFSDMEITAETGHIQSQGGLLTSPKHPNPPNNFRTI